MDKVLQISEVYKSYPLHNRSFRFSASRLKTILQNINFSMSRSEIVALVGESGSGKSTIARLILGLESPDQGSIQHYPSSCNRLNLATQLARRKQVQLIFQDPFAAINPVHKVSYILERPLRRFFNLSGQKLKDRIEELLNMVGLTPVQDIMACYPHSLSGGQRQRVVIARALAAEPQLLVADEPTSMLDVSIRIDILNLLDSLRKATGLSILFITHDLASAAYLADRMLVLLGGMIVEEGSTEDIVENPSHPYTRQLLASLPGSTIKLQENGLAEPSKQAHTNNTRPGQKCPFFERCQFQEQVCAELLPSLNVISKSKPQHRSRCHLAASGKKRVTRHDSSLQI